MFRIATSKARIFIPLFLFSFLCYSILQGQTAKIGYLKGPDMVPPVGGDTSVLRVQGLPQLQALQGVNVPAPTYSYLWIFDDGDYMNMGADSTVHHYYSNLSAAGAHNPVAYVTGLYGGGSPPPKMAMPGQPIQPAPTANSPQVKTNAVKPGAFIELQKNHQNLVPDDSTVWIISIKNNYQGDISLNGQVYLFYNGVVETAKDTVTYVPATINGTAQFADFDLETTHIYRNEVLTPTIFLNPIPNTTLRNQYQKAAFWSYNNLRPGEERHFFVRFHNDKNLLSKFPEEQLGRLKFMAVMTINGDTNVDVQLSTGEDKLANRIGLNTLFTETGQQLRDSLNAYFPPGQTNGTITFGNRILDLAVSTAALAAAHDPNHLDVNACSCPPTSKGAQELLYKVRFSNDGNAPATNVKIRVLLAPEVDINSISHKLISTYPQLNPNTISFHKTGTNEVEWELSNVFFQSAKLLGADNPSTYGQIVFKALTLTGTDINNVGVQQACISFNGGSEVCTTPAKATPIVGTGSMAGELLKCTDNCKIGADGQWFSRIPLWLLLLLIFLVLLALWAAYRYS